MQIISDILHLYQKSVIMNASAFIIIDLNALADTQITDLLPSIGQLYHNASLIWYNECKAFIIIDLNALVDTQITDLLPAIGRLYHIRFAYMV
jgi:hypothetical protein